MTTEPIEEAVSAGTPTEEETEFDGGFDEATGQGQPAPKAKPEPGAAKPDPDEDEGDSKGSDAGDKDDTDGEKTGTDTDEQGEAGGGEEDADKDKAKAGDDEPKTAAEKAEARAAAKEKQQREESGKNFMTDLVSAIADPDLDTPEKVAAIADSEPFRAWLKKAPASMRVAARSTDAEAAAEVVKAYKTQADVSEKGKGDEAESPSVTADALVERLGNTVVGKDQSGNDMTLNKLREESGSDIFDGLVNTIALVVKEMGLGKKPEPAPKFVTPEELAKRDEAIHELRFYSQVERTHPDIRQVERDEKFTAWLGKQPKRIQGLAATWDPEDLVSVADAYKEHLAQEHKAEQDKAKGKKTGERRALHAETVSSRRQSRGNEPTEEDAEQEYEDAWHQATKK